MLIETIVPIKVRTEALKGFIVEMHGSGSPDSEIADRFGLNRAYIQQLRSAMGLKPNHGKQAPRFSEDTDILILQMRDEDSLPWAEIGRSIDRPAREVAERYTFLDQRRTEEAEKGPVVVHTLNCLKCRKLFQSMDKKRNRVCGPCADENSQYGDYLDCIDHGSVSSLD